MANELVVRSLFSTCPYTTAKVLGTGADAEDMSHVFSRARRHICQWLDLLRSKRNRPVDYKRLVEESLDLLLQVRIVPGNFVIEYASSSSLQLLGWNGKEMLQLKPSDFVHPRSMQLMAQTIDRLLAGHATQIEEAELLRKDGSIVWANCRIRMLEPDTGNGCVVVVNLNDVTERKNLERQLADLVLVDALTGVGSRRAFDEALSREWDLAAQNRQPLSVIMVDVDHFKQINDTHGHQLGDQCLRAIAEAMQRMVDTPRAFIARYGGEEMVALLPGVTQEVATLKAQSMCDAVQTLQVYTVNRLTVSCGVATALYLFGLTIAEPERLVAAADSALYEAKRTGRNRVAVAGQQAIPFSGPFSALNPDNRLTI